MVFIRSSGNKIFLMMYRLNGVAKRQIVALRGVGVIAIWRIYEGWIIVATLGISKPGWFLS